MIKFAESKNSTFYFLRRLYKTLHNFICKLPKILENNYYFIVEFLLLYVWVRQSHDHQCHCFGEQDPVWKRIIKYSPQTIKKKTRVLDTLDTNKKYFIQIIVGWNPQDIWTMILFKYGTPLQNWFHPTIIFKGHFLFVSFRSI